MLGINFPLVTLPSHQYVLNLQIPLIPLIWSNNPFKYPWISITPFSIPTNHGNIPLFDSFIYHDYPMKSLWSLPWFPSRFAGGLGVLETPGLEAQDCSFGGCHALRAPVEVPLMWRFFGCLLLVVPQWAKSLSWLITPITMVYGRYIDILTMVYKPTYNWGGTTL